MTEPGHGRPALRTASAVVVSLVAVPLLLVNAYLLLWFLPELTAGGATGGGGPYRWLLVFVLTVVAAVCLVLGVTRRHRAGRWWMWLLAAPVLLAIGSTLADSL
jgi:hypothetical protein